MTDSGSTSDLWSDDSCADKSYDVRSEAQRLSRRRLSSSEEEAVRQFTQQPETETRPDCHTGLVHNGQSICVTAIFAGFLILSLKY